MNRGRRKRRRVNENIEEREWKDYFMRLLGEVEHRVVRGNWDRRREDGEGKMSKEEIRGMIRRLKDGKAGGYDGIPGEVWKYGGKDLVNWGWNFCKGVWKGVGWSEGWKERVIVSIVKKGEGKTVEEYRGGMTLMAVLYKVYVMELTERLREECEAKRVIPQNQTGFRKGMGTMDNIYVINYLIHRKLGRGKRVVALFVDLRAVFDTVDREILHETMKTRGIREGLVERMKEALKETKSRVRAGG